MREQAVIQFGAVRIPSVVLGIAGSAAVHAAALAVLYVALADRAPNRTDAEALLARGQPILVRLVESEEEEDPLPEPETIDEPITPEPETEPDIEPAPVETELPEPAAEAPSEGETGPIQKASDWCEETMDLLADSAAEAMEQSVARAIAIERVLSEMVARMSEPRQQLAVAPTPEPMGPPPPPLHRSQTEQQPAATPPPQAARPAESSKPQRSTSQPVGVTSGAAVVSVPKPLYPSRSIRLGQEGTVEIEVEVLPDGSVAAARIASGSGHRLLDRAALDAAKQGSYTPAMENGRAVSATIIVPFEFRLN